MRSFFAFLKKDWTEHLRSGRLLILLIIFTLLGVLNPATAKLTPWLLDVMADSMATSGITLTLPEPCALDSWVQFFKNLPMGLIAFLLLESSIFTREYQSGTLTLMLTRGLPRSSVAAAKAILLAVLWTLAFWLCYGITYLYTDWYWDQSNVQNLLFSAFCSWLAGLMATALIVLFSTVSRSNTGVLLGTGGFFLVAMLLKLFPKLIFWSPATLMDGNALIYGTEEPAAYGSAILVAAVVILLSYLLSGPIFQKKQL